MKIENRMRIQKRMMGIQLITDIENKRLTKINQIVKRRGIENRS